MALRHVLVLIQVSSLRSDRQAHLTNKQMKAKSESVGERNTLSLFVVFFLLFFIIVNKYSLLSRLKCMSLSATILDKVRTICFFVADKRE